MTEIFIGYKVKVRDGDYTDRPQNSRYNLPRGVGTVVRGSSQDGFLVVNYPSWGDSPPVSPSCFEKVIIVEPRFEVGKKYLFEANKGPTKRIYECVWADAKTSSAMFTYEQDGKNFGALIGHVYRTQYIEYIEPPKPRSLSVWFNIYADPNNPLKLQSGHNYETKAEALNAGKSMADIIVETVEYVYTEKL